MVVFLTEDDYVLEKYNIMGIKSVLVLYENLIASLSIIKLFANQNKIS